jgi:ribose transport system permease protein
MSASESLLRGLTPNSLKAMTGVGAIPVMALIAFIAVYAVVNPQLLSDFQLETVADQVAPLGLVALAELVVVLTGGIDVSVGAMLSLSNVVFVSLLGQTSVAAAMLTALATGTVGGVINGMLSALANLPTIVVTLATGFIYGATAIEVMDAPGGRVPATVISMTSGSLAQFVPAAAAWLLAGGALIWCLLHRTVFGRLIIGVGSSRSGIRAIGRNAALVQIAAFAVAGILTGAAAIVLAGTTATGDPHAGDPYLLNVIAAVALGGARFSGGVGSVSGTVAAAMILALIGNLLFFAGINSFWQYIVGALIIVTVVGFPHLLRLALAMNFRVQR